MTQASTLPILGKATNAGSGGLSSTDASRGALSPGSPQETTVLADAPLSSGHDNRPLPVDRSPNGSRPTPAHQRDAARAPRLAARSTRDSIRWRPDHESRHRVRRRAPLRRPGRDAVRAPRRGETTAGRVLRGDASRLRSAARAVGYSVSDAYLARARNHTVGVLYDLRPACRARRLRVRCSGGGWGHPEQPHRPARSVPSGARRRRQRDGILAGCRYRHEGLAVEP